MRAKNLYFLPCLLLLVLSTACNKGKGGEEDPFAGLEKVTYTESDAVFFAVQRNSVGKVLIAGTLPDHGGCH